MLKVQTAAENIIFSEGKGPKPLLFFARDFAIAIFGYVFELNIGLRLLNNHCMD
jgi:hypothetical protein